MELIKRFFRKRAIKSYIKKLPSQLMKDYGKAKTYTPKQVKRSIGENCDYDVMRCELAGNYFNGNSNFSGADVTSLSSDFASGFDSDGYAGGDGGKVTKHLYEY
jgi:hypothetical protein